MTRTIIMAIVALGATAAMAGERFVTVAPKVRLFVKELGAGTPIVVLHGGPGMDSNYLIGNLEPLARVHRVIFFDQRGSGRSTLTRNVTPDQLVADLDALRRKLGLKKLTLLGHSWGAGLAALYAAAHPDRVERMILADAIPARRSGLAGYNDLLQSRLTEDERARYSEALAAREQAKTPEEHVAACRAFWGVFAKAYYSDPSAVVRDKGDLCAASGEALASGRDVNASVMGALGDYDWRPLAARFHMPVLVIHGADDPIRLENAREWADTIPNAQLVVIEHAGHMSYVEAPEEFFRLVEAFVSSHT